MVIELQERQPFLTPTTTDKYCMKWLNQAYRWMEGLGSFVWNLKYTTVAVVANALTSALPEDFNAGKLRIMFKTFTLKEYNADEFQLYRRTPSAGEGAFTTWMVYNNPGVGYVARFAPDDSVHLTLPVTFDLFYHRNTPAELTMGYQIYFPSPDEFDDLIVDLAEAEAMRRYKHVGWQLLLQKAQDSAMKMLDQYRSGKVSPAGLVEQTRKAQEKRAERTG
jgi:hypothetical protein